MNTPRRLKHYEILSRIGEGGMGVVYRARDTRLGRTVALKVLHDELSGDDERSRRFEREARIVSSMSHPGIATVFDFDRDGATAFFAMELVEGATLRQRLRQGPLPPEEVLDCAVQVAEALAAAHREGVIHRDLKPENVIAASSGYYKVLDFGVARLERPAQADGPQGTLLDTLSWATSAGGLLGTVAYMSPEQALAEPLDARSDLFSFGSLVHELATGRPAFRGNNAIATANEIVHGHPGPMRAVRPEMPLGLELIVDKCLAKRPDDRYRSADDLVHDLRTLQLDSLTTSRAHRRLLAHRDSPARRRARAWGLAGAALAATAALAALFILQGGPDSSSSEPSAPASADPVSALPAAAAEPARIVVAFFENHTADPAADWLRRGLPEMLTTDLSRSGKLEVIATQRLYDLAAMAGSGEGPDLDRATVAELARWAGANVVISGSVFKLDEVWRIDAQAYDTRTGTVRLARKVTGSDLFRMVNELTAALREGLQIDTGTKVSGIELAATTSEEAFRLFTRASGDYENLRYDDAVGELERSLQIDPGFALARLRLALSLDALGLDGEAARRTAELMPDVERLPEADRMLARALDALVRERDLEAGSAILDRLTSRFPRHGEAWVVWARALDRLGQDPLGATRKLKRALEEDPNNLPAIVELAGQLARFGATDDAERILRQAARRNPGAAPAIDTLVPPSPPAPLPSR